jgi:kumamolisin
MSTRNQLITLPWACLAAVLLTVNTGAAQAPGGGFTIRPATVPGGGRTIVLKSASGEVIPVRPGARFFTPPSGLERRPGFAHTNIKVGIPPKGGFPKVVRPLVAPPPGPPFAGFLFETPASLACVYRLVTVASGCEPNTVTTNVTGGSQAIAIVDAFDSSPTAATDLAAFDAQFGVTPATFTVIFGTGLPSAGCVNGTQPPSATGTGWDIQESADIEMANAFAPGAHIYLVEAASAALTDLLNAVAVATACVQLSNSGEVSMSWGENEFSGETAHDSTFTGARVLFLAAAGDAPGTQYPAASPNVIGVGGTTISRDQTTGFFQSEAIWNNSADYLVEFGDAPIGTGGGPSLFEPTPTYQSNVAAIVGLARGTPDIAAVADPTSGVWIFNTSSFGGWGNFGGTGIATQLAAAVINRSGLIFGSSFKALTNIYALPGKGTLTKFFTNVSSGLCGPGGSTNFVNGTAAFPNSYGEGYDPEFTLSSTLIPYNLCTGWGTLHGSH